MKKIVQSAVFQLKNKIDKDKIADLLKVEDQNKKVSCRRVRERRAARVETLPNGDQRSNDRRSDDRRQNSANLKNFWTAIFVWAGLAVCLTIAMVFARFSEIFLFTVIGFYTLSLLFFIYLSYLFSQSRNRRRSDKSAYFYVVLGIFALFSFVMCEVGIFLF